uniref:Uncharacterized protein n=1 Tax=Quercus lobata TaxID=97700 RepID=A0A7N2MYN2_QUELO
MTAMTEFEDDLLLAWVCCCRLWLLLTRVHLLWVMAFDRWSLPPWVESILRLGFEWVVGLNRLWFLVKHGIHMRKHKQKIMSTLELDKDSHDISIVFRALQQLVGTQVFYNSIPLKCDDDVDIMWGVIKRAGQFIGSDLYVTVDTVGFNVDRVRSMLVELESKKQFL